MKKEVKPKQYFDIRIECMLPATVTYRVLAENAEDAINLIKNKPPHSVSYKLNGKRDLVIRVYDAGSSMMRFIKKVLNR